MPSDANCLPELGKNDFSAQQESALVPLKCAALAADRDSIAYSRYALFTALPELQHTAFTPSPRAAASKIDVMFEPTDEPTNDACIYRLHA